jgi:hypothetical protein
MVYNGGMRKAGTLLLLTLVMSTFVAGRAFAQEKASVTVFPFTGAGIPEAELESLTLIFEESLLRLDFLEVIDRSKREKVLAYLDPSLLACVKLDCLLRAGRALSADAIVLGTISTTGGQFVLTVKVVDLGTGRSRQTESAGSLSVAELGSATRLLASTLFEATAPGPSGRAQAAAELEGAQRLKALESLAADLRANIAEIDKKRAAVRKWGWVFVGVGAASAGLAGTSLYLADRAYQNYKSTTDIDLAAFYRSRVTLWDALTLVSAGAGVLSIGGSIPFFVLGPSSRAENKELKRIEAEMSALQNPQEETK